MGQHDHLGEDEAMGVGVGVSLAACEVFSEESLSRSDSVDHLSVHHLDDGSVEERFRVDRRKLEAMILGRPPQPGDLDLRLPMTSDGCVMTAEAFFRKIMDETDTEIRYPKFLKAGARSKKDPHVRVVGSAEAVRQAGLMVRQELDPPNKVTMKMDVPWKHHSHIIGKGGTTIQPVVRRTGVSIHFPDGNKSSEMRKSNQVSINSRGEDLSGLEEARKAIRSLTPLTFHFTLSASVQFTGTVVDPTMLVLHVQTTYNVQVELRVVEEMTLMGVVKGTETEAQQAMAATRYILQAYCSTLANQVPIQMHVDVSPQHHSFVLGRSNEHVRRIMHRTSTNIIFPDWTDSALSPLKKSTVSITGAIENVYLARQNIIGSLPLVLMFDLVVGAAVDMLEVSQMMNMLDVQIILKTCRNDGRRPVVVKTAERNAANLYEAWRMLCRVDSAPPKVRIPVSYHLPNRTQNTCQILGGWVGGGSGDSSPLPSPTSTPTPPTPLLPTPMPNTSLWGGLTPTATTNNTTTLLPPLPRLDSLNTPSLYPSQAFPSDSLNNYNHLHCIGNGTCILPPPHPYPGNTGTNGCVGSGGGGGGVILDSLVKSMKGLAMHNGDHSHSCSSSSSPSQSPRDSTPDQTLLASTPSTASATPSPPTAVTACTAASVTVTSTSHFPAEDTTQTTPDMDALSELLKDLDWRAPGCEKKHKERVAAHKMTLSDYSSKKVEAARAMKQDVGSNPRIPNSTWSGYGFSKSMPGFVIRQKLQEAKDSMQNGVGGSGLDEWGDTWQHKDEGGGGGGGGGAFPTTTTTSNTPSPPSQPINSLQYHNSISQFSLGGDKVLGGLGVRPAINLSASNFMDCVLPRRDRETHATSSSALHNSSSSSPSSSSQHLDVISILNDLQLPQYIDVFVGQEVDLNMFMSLEDYDLKELGITIFGHRKRILMAIKDLTSKTSLFGGGLGSNNSGLGGSNSGLSGSSNGGLGGNSNGLSSGLSGSSNSGLGGVMSRLDPYHHTHHKHHTSALTSSTSSPSSAWN